MPRDHSPTRHLLAKLLLSNQTRLHTIILGTLSVPGTLLTETQRLNPVTPDTVYRV